MFENVKWKNDGKIRLLIVVGTRPEIIRLSAVIGKCRRCFDTLLVHTGQNYDYNLNGVFFRDLGIADPDVYLDAVGADLGETMGNIIAKSYRLMAEITPDAVLVLGDTNSCLSVIGAKRLHIPIFHMEAGNRCKDECLPEETNRRIVDIISDVNLTSPTCAQTPASPAVVLSPANAPPKTPRPPWAPPQLPPLIVNDTLSTV